METRVALVGIVLSSKSAVKQMNDIVQEYSQYVVGRMGVPYPKKDISVISIMMDAPQDVISAFSGKVGMLKDVSSKTIYAKMEAKMEE